MPVEYNSVNTKIPEYWLKYNPTLVIHLGVSPGAKEIRLEKYAHNTNYAALDNLNTIPENKCCICDAPEEICSQLPLENVCAFVKRKSSLPIAVSDDAGRYLCEFIYYQSLYIDSKRCVFIHVPCLDENKFTTEHLAETIQQVVYELLRHVEPLPVLNSNGQYGKQHNTTKIINTKPVTLKS
ncbi:unnamed protein product [Didymodactylos carnosus]|nr:unnamed protein product [Didymodactylos carnosus]CAF4325817.1 unnamed protein product [Didymodactylos carnosus]